MSPLDQVLPHLPRLRRYARLLTGDAVRADDLLQDTLERAARKWALWQPQANRLGPGSALRGWLLSLMHNLYLNQRRDDRDARHDPLADEHEPAHEPVLQLQHRLDLERALAQLSAPAREVMLLVCVEEFSYEEAARILGVPVGTVMSRLWRAREHLRRLMAGEALKDPPLRVVKK